MGNEEQIEIVVIDNSRISFNLTNLIFQLKNVNNKGVVGFNYPAAALAYLSQEQNIVPKLILLESIANNGNFDTSFFDAYNLLNRKDFFYVVSVSLDTRVKTKCLSYSFVKKYITKPLEVVHIKEMIRAHGLKIKERETKGI